MASTNPTTSRPRIRLTNLLYAAELRGSPQTPPVSNVWQITFNMPVVIARRYHSIGPSPDRRPRLPAEFRRRPRRMVKAYVLIVTNPGSTRAVLDHLREIPNVQSVHEVMGPYDIVVELVTDTLTDIPPILSDRIRTVDGIQSTTSLVAFPNE